MKNRLFENERRSTLKLTNDFVFHYIYGKDTENSKKALIGLLNLILERDFDPIESVTIKNPINYRDYEYDKETVMDIKAETNNGLLLDIEMQTSNYQHFNKRCIYNASQLVKDSLQSGEKYAKMNTSLVISIVEDKIFKDEMNLHSKFCYMETTVHKLLSDVTQIHLLELGRVDVDKPVEEMSTEEKLCAYFKYACDKKYEDYIEKILKDVEGLAMTEVIFDELTKDERAYDLARRKALWKADREDEMDWAMTEGRAEGFQEGEAKTSALFQKLLEANRIDDLKKAASDKNYRDELFKEFNL